MAIGKFMIVVFLSITLTQALGDFLLLGYNKQADRDAPHRINYKHSIRLTCTWQVVRLVNVENTAFLRMVLDYWNNSQQNPLE